MRQQPIVRSQSSASSTAQFGKRHEVPVLESSPVKPFDGWSIALFLKQASKHGRDAVVVFEKQICFID
jgi:hypothetical protein